jgi:hypothetical protein
VIVDEPVFSVKPELPVADASLNATAGVVPDEQE